MLKEQRELRNKIISEHHADVSGKNNPMYGHSIKEFMTDEQYKLWRQHLKERNLSGERNGAYGRVWIRHLKTDQQKYLKRDEAINYVKSGEWEYGTQVKRNILK